MSTLTVENLTKYFGGLAAVKEISFEVGDGEILGLIGPNGSGKTTIFNLISQYLKVTRGRIIFNGQDITRKKIYEVARLGIGRTFQVVKPLKKLTVEENVLVAAFSREKSFSGAHKVAREVLAFCHLGNESQMIAEQLSIAGKKRLEMAKALATRPLLLLLDETSAGLNPMELDIAVDIIQKIRNELGITLVIVEHVMKMIMSISDRIHAIAYGATIAEGTPEEIAKHPMVVEAYLGSGFKMEMI
jgi:branched-chain amino acid transport system ATP-binding protein